MSGEDNTSVLEYGLAPRLVTPGEVAPAAPSVVLHDPKYPHNVAAALRACAIFTIPQLWFSGERVIESIMGSSSKRGKARIPREERMRDYKSVKLFSNARPLELLGSVGTPVAVEVRENAESLVDFVHPLNPIYVFGPEDGSIPGVILQHCHRFVVIPTKHCLNLGAAVNVILYDRLAKSRR